MLDLLHRLAHWRPFRALVVGDFMLDQAVYGDASRLSPDAPVPVLHVDRTEQSPGGAANVCLDLVALHGRVAALGVLGADAEGDLLRAALEREGVDGAGLATDPTRPTTVKRSLIGLAQQRHPQKMFRVDVETRRPLDAGVARDLLARFDAALPHADVVCLEDYAKGVCTPEVCREVAQRTRRAGKELLVDPAAGEDYEKYRGAACITPNRTEAGLALQRSLDAEEDPSRLAPLAEELLRGLDLQAVVLTLDRQGALLVERAGSAVRALHVPTVARQVYDVTGAGDMVLAALAAARANGVDWPQAVHFANTAAGHEVEVFGVKPIPLETIHRSLLIEGRRLRGKARTLAEAIVEVRALRREGRRIVFTNGCFDILHAGHIALLRSAARHGDAQIVGLNTDDSVRRLKGAGRPLHNEEDRAMVLGELESVTMVVPFGEDTPLRLIEALKPDVLVKGADYEKDRVVGADLVESWGGRVEIAPLLKGRSTTSAIERARASSGG